MKEKHSTVILTPFECQVKIMGDVIDPMEYLNFTDIRFRIDYVDKNSYGALVFNHPVNLPFIVDNFDDIFDVYIKNVTYVYHITPMTLLNFEILNTTADNTTINFRC